VAVAGNMTGGRRKKHRRREKWRRSSVLNENGRETPETYQDCRITFKETVTIICSLSGLRYEI